MRLFPLRHSAEGRFVEAPQFARMELGDVAAQLLDGFKPDHQVLAHRAVVEGVGRTGQLDLAMQRLVGDASKVP